MAVHPIIVCDMVEKVKHPERFALQRIIKCFKEVKYTNVHIYHTHFSPYIDFSVRMRTVGYQIVIIIHRYIDSDRINF